MNTAHFHRYTNDMTATSLQRATLTLSHVEFVNKVARHATGEEIVVYWLPFDGETPWRCQLADHGRTDHSQFRIEWTAVLLPAIAQILCGPWRSSFTNSRISMLVPPSNYTMKQVVDHLRPHNDSEETTTSKIWRLGSAMI